MVKLLGDAGEQAREQRHLEADGLFEPRVGGGEHHAVVLLERERVHLLLQVARLQQEDHRQHHASEHLQGTFAAPEGSQLIVRQTLIVIIQVHFLYLQNNLLFLDFGRHNSVHFECVKFDTDPCCYQILQVGVDTRVGSG